MNKNQYQFKPIYIYINIYKTQKKSKSELINIESEKK